MLNVQVLVRLCLFAASTVTAISLCSARPQDAKVQPSSSYSQTLQALSAWDGMGDDQAGHLAAFFAKGNGMVPDLLQACKTGDEDIVARAYGLLLMIGSNKTEECASRVHEEDSPVMLATSDQISEADFTKLEQLFRSQPCENSGKCKQEDLPLVDESVVYALVLDGSKRARTVLNRMSKLAKASKSEDMLGFDVASNAEALISQAQERAHNLTLEPSTFEELLRQSIFFLQDSVRGTAGIKLLARNASDDRMLLTVFYTCGMLCGSGYYVVLKRNPNGTWDYALIMRAWIS